MQGCRGWWSAGSLFKTRFRLNFPKLLPMFMVMKPDDPTAITTIAGDVATADTIAALADAFDGVCKVGVFYPAGHALCDQAAETFLRAMIKVVGPAPALTVAVDGPSLTIQGVAVDTSSVSAARLQALFGSVGIVAAELHRDLTASDLYAFVRVVFAQRARLRNGADGRSLSFDDVPSRVRLSIGALPAPAPQADGVSIRVHALQASLARRGVPPAPLDTCRRLLTALPDRLHERREVDGVWPRVNWDHLEQILVASCRAADQPPATDDDALAGALRTLTADADAIELNDAVDLLLASATGGPEPRRSGDGERRRQDDPAAVFDPVHAFLTSVAAAQPPDLASTDRRETIGMLMLMLGRDLPAAARTHAERMIREVVHTSLTPPEREVLVGGLRELAAHGSSHLAATTALVCNGLRRVSPQAALAFLCDVGSRCDAEQLGGIWPFLVNEVVLTGPSPDPALYGAACSLAAGLPDEAARLAQPRLETLECLRGQKIAADALRALTPDLRRVLSWLLETPRSGPLAKQLIAALKTSPQGWLGDVTLPAIEQATTADRQFLAAWLRLRDLSRPTPEVVQLATGIIVVGVAGLPPRRRREAWVSPALAVLGRARHTLAPELLRRVRRERRLLLWPAWPPACRRVAAGVLSNLDGKIETEPS